ncbi:uncharacterized protein LOC142982971 [Anticarsia gemmatalis]|uniref:uncharacterized protein LOC142982971 n=1 Tax=Anticarsia gemmatalis TaxID=129554 RepID=UPI003F7764A3
MCKMSLCALVCVCAFLAFTANGVGGIQFRLWKKDDRKSGVEASSNLVHHNPWLVYIEYYRGENLMDIRCAGTLIDKRHIITAAHCIKNPRFTKLVARLGEYDLNSEVDCVQNVCADPPVTIDVEETFVHPNYKKRKEHDIAILKLSKDAPYTDFIRPISLPSGHLDSDTTFIATGWGEIPLKGVYSHVKKIVPLPLWTREACEKAYENKIVLPPSVICAGGEEGIDTCRGDSGGPLTRVQDTIELWGVTSGGSTRCGEKNSPGVYTKVIDYLDWIQSVIDNNLSHVSKSGVEASTNLVHHNPWLVYIEYYRGEHLIDVRCAGSLIDERHIITAAHCIKHPRFNRLVARLGEYDLYSKVDCVQGVCADPVVKIEVEEIIVHPEYDGKEHDIAILRLAKDAPYTDFIRPISLPSGVLESHTTFFASGWGEIPQKGVYSHVKKIVPLPLWTRKDCQASYKHITLPESVICAGGEEGIDTCRGDSGGPLTRVQDTVELWGVTSGGNSRCGTKNSPGVYTKVIDYLDWIQSVIDSDRRKTD